MLDIGAAGGGNTAAVRRHGFEAVALEFSSAGSIICSGRGVPVINADAHRAPVRSGSVDVVIAYDVLEHLSNDTKAATEIARILRPGGVVLISVPADPSLWSDKDVRLGHHRRYTKHAIESLVTDAGLEIAEGARAWNVLLRPLARRARTRGGEVSEAEFTPVPTAMNVALHAVLGAERWIPGLGALRGMSWILVARKIHK